MISESSITKVVLGIASLYSSANSLMHLLASYTGMIVYELLKSIVNKKRFSLDLLFPQNLF